MLKLLILALMLGADDAPLVDLPTELSAKPGRLLKITVKTNGRVVRWVAFSDDCDIIPFPDGRSAIFSASEQGTYRILVYTALGDQPSEPAVCTVIVGKPGPKPPVPPNPDPPTPGPSDPLTKKLQAAFEKDASELAKKREWVKTMSVFFLEVGKHIEKKSDDGSYVVSTIGDLLSDYQKAIPSVLPKGVLQEVRVACADEVFAVTGEDTEKKINAELRKQLSELFLKISKALEGVK